MQGTSAITHNGSLDKSGGSGGGEKLSGWSTFFNVEPKILADQLNTKCEKREFCGVSVN